jgi:hypothetical protein
MAIVTECEVANVMECELTNIEHYNQQLKNDVEGQIQECMEQIQQCLNHVNNLNSVSLVVTRYAPVFAVVNNLETNHNSSEAKPDNRKVCSSDTVSACDKSRYTCGMCGFSFIVVHVLKEHALDVHGIKHIVIKGSNLEDSMRRCRDSDILESIENEHKDPKNVSSQQLYQTTRLCWILLKPFTTNTTDVNFSIYEKRSEISKADCSLCGKQFEQQSYFDVHKYVQLDPKLWPLKYALCQKYFITKKFLQLSPPECA